MKPDLTSDEELLEALAASSAGAGQVAEQRERPAGSGPVAPLASPSTIIGPASRGTRSVEASRVSRDQKAAREPSVSAHRDPSLDTELQAQLAEILDEYLRAVE